MINNSGAIASVCKIDGKLYAQAFKKYYFIIAAIIGFSAIGIGLEVLLITKFSAADIFILVCFCVLLVLGVCLLILILWAVKKNGASQKICKCEIYRDCLIASVYDNDTKISEAVTDYSKLYKTAEVKGYFLAYVNKNSFCPVFKADLTTEEMNAVRKLLGLRVLQGAEVAEVAAYHENHCAENV